MTVFASPVLAQGEMLVSPWKALLILVPILPWAWMVASVYDKHAARFHLPRRKWNLVHMIAAMLAVAVGLFAPLPLKNEGAFWVGFAGMLLILSADLYAYAFSANRDDRVPERYHIRLNLDQLREAREAKKAAKLQSKVSLTITGPDKQPVLSPQPETPEYEVRLAAETVYQAAMSHRASQVDVTPAGKDGVYAVSFLVDGVRQPGEPMPAAAALKVMDFWKAAAKLDVADRRRKLMGECTVEAEGVRHVVRVQSVGVQGGMRLTMLFDPAGAVRRKITELGLLDPQMAELKAITAEELGVVLLSAPLDAGRTTTLYAVVRMHDAYTSNVQTLEIDLQSPLEGVRQNKFDPMVEGAEFSTTLRSILRRDPDVVAAAELPDENTAKEAVNCDLDRTRIYLSFRADTSLGALQTFVKATGDSKKAAAALHGVLCQRLLRKLCTNCRVPYPPAPEMLKKLGIPEGKVQQLFKKGGQVLIKNRPEVCPVCSGIGYLGQEGIFEVFRVLPEERELIAAGNWQGLWASFRKRGLPSMQQAALLKAISGVTSVEEVMRVTSSEGAAKKPDAAPAGAAAANA